MKEILPMLQDSLVTPIGRMLIVFDHEGRLRAIDWAGYETRMRRLLYRQYRGCAQVSKGRLPGGIRDALRRYFAGDVEAIAGLPVRTAGTAFQRKVWRALRRIPAGRTISYAQLARRIAHPRATRAVGLANGANPIGVVVPCHRVIASDGSLSGYGGGVARKRWLLDHEKTGRCVFPGKDADPKEMTSRSAR